MEPIAGQASTEGGSSSLKETHGALALSGWGVLMPIGILVARYCKHWDPLWFYTHISVQGLSFGLGLAGVITGFSLEEKVGKDVDTHKALGILILVLGALQVCMDLRTKIYMPLQSLLLCPVLALCFFSSKW